MIFSWTEVIFVFAILCYSILNKVFHVSGYLACRIYIDNTLNAELFVCGNRLLERKFEHDCGKVADESVITDEGRR